MTHTNKSTPPVLKNTTKTHALSLSIDLDAVRQNYRTIKTHLSTDTECAAVVKADAYGMGMKECSTIFRSEGCRSFFVASLDEGLALREQHDDIRIFILHGLNGFQTEQQLEPYITHNLIPVLNSFAEITLWHAAAANADTQLPCLIHVDTGMHRLGISAEEWAHFLEQKGNFPYLDILYVMSHLACADDLSSEMTDAQYQRFLDVCAQAPQTHASFANSAGLFLDPKMHFDLVRPGAALYGLQLHDKQPLMQPVIYLDAPILQIQTLAPTDTVGYGATYQSDSNRVVATIPLGYAQGYLRSSSNEGAVFLHGAECPVIGRISMDLATIDITNIAHKTKRSDRVEILGQSQTADRLAQNAGTIGYEILTGLGKIKPRQYIRS